MAKKKTSFNFGIILIFLGLILGLAALVCFAGDGLIQTMEHGKENLTSHCSLAGFLTGNITVKITSSLVDESIKGEVIEGYRSYFVIFALVLTILAALATLIGVGLNKKGKGLLIAGGLLFILAGIFIFLIKVAGTNPENLPTFNEIFNEEKMGFDLGLGTIFYGVLSILGGLTVTAGAVLKK